MSTKKRKNAQSLEEIYEAIKDLLITIKPRLDDVTKGARASLNEDLHTLAANAEMFTKQRPRSNKSHQIEMADNLDREGVSLWNVSGVVNRTADDDGRVLVGALRLAGFRLVEAGLESKPSIKTLLHVLQLASKTGATLSELGNHDMAHNVLSSAAKFEEAVNSSDGVLDDDSDEQAKVSATVVYLSSCMEAAWRQSNINIADMMLAKIGKIEQINLIPTHVRELLASKVGEIGKSWLVTGKKGGGAKATDAVKWLQTALAMTEKLDDSEASGLPELKISILRSLAKAYFLSACDDPEGGSDNLSRAEATLAEILPSLDSSADHASSEYQILRWQRLAVLKRKKNAGDAALVDAFKSIIDHMAFTEATVTDILQEFRSYTHQHVLITAVNQYCLKRALGCHDSGSQFVDRLLLSLIFHCSKDENHASAMQDIETAFTCMCESDFQLPTIPTVACLTLLWKYGDRQYKAKKWAEAAEWFLAGSHKAFYASSPTSSSKCFRKAALCYLEQNQYAMAETVIRRCPQDQATTHYVLLLVALQRRLEHDAIGAVDGMTRAPDFDRKMLLLATHMSHDLEMKSLLVTVLKHLLKTLSLPLNGETALDGMTLIRCIIRLVLKLLVEPGANQPALIDNLIDQFHTAKKLVESAAENKAASLIVKEISWLWRTAYNTAVQGCAEWETSPGRVSSLFEISRDLLELFCTASPIDVDADLYMSSITSSFAAVSGRVFAAREVKDVTSHSMRVVADDVHRCQTRIQAIKTKITQPEEVQRVSSFLHVLRVFETEALVRLKDWNRIESILKELAETDESAVPTYSAIADILWVEKECPTAILHLSLEVILHASLDRSSISVEKFARWLRALCSILLATNTVANRATSLGYFEQALAVIQTSHDAEGDDAYPMDERQWILVTAYNTGMECLHASLLDEAKRWFEVSTMICRFVPNGEASAEKISDQYTHLLARYTRS